MRDAFWIGLIVAALAAIGGGYLQGAMSARPPPVATLRSTKSDAHASGSVRERDPAHGGDLAASDQFASDDVVVERTRPIAPQWRREELAVFVGLCGTSIAAESQFLRLGLPLNFVVDPHAPQARTFAQLVRAADDELFVQVSAAPSASTIASLTHALGAFDGVASRNASGMAAALHGTGLAYFDERGDAEPAAFAEAGVPFVRRDVTADDRSGAGYIAFMLARASEISRRTGTVTVLMRPLPSSLAALRDFSARHDVAIVAAAVR